MCQSDCRPLAADGGAGECWIKEATPTPCGSGCTSTELLSAPASCSGSDDGGGRACELNADGSACAPAAVDTCSASCGSARNCVYTAPATAAVCVPDFVDVDCATGYTPGDAAHPSTTCPSGCTLTAAVSSAPPTCDLDASTDGTCECPAGCDYSACTDAECCTVIPRTCADTDADGADDPHDCSDHSNGLSATAAEVHCEGRLYPGQAGYSEHCSGSPVISSIGGPSASWASCQRVRGHQDTAGRQDAVLAHCLANREPLRLLLRGHRLEHKVLGEARPDELHLERGDQLLRLRR